MYILSRYSWGFVRWQLQLQLQIRDTSESLLLPSDCGWVCLKRKIYPHNDPNGAPPRGGPEYCIPIPPLHKVPEMTQIEIIATRDETEAYLRPCIFPTLHSKSSVLKHGKEGCCSKQEWVLGDGQILSAASEPSEGSAGRGQRKQQNGTCFKAERLWCSSLQAKGARKAFKI